MVYSIVFDLFFSHGAKEVGFDEQKSKRSGPVFRGSGYRLGEEEGTSEIVPGPSAPTRDKEVR
jgi:hypothetical protein